MWLGAGQHALISHYAILLVGTDPARTLHCTTTHTPCILISIILLRFDNPDSSSTVLHRGCGAIVDIAVQKLHTAHSVTEYKPTFSCRSAALVIEILPL
ncbi:hypothetical protein V8C42DRAFT_323958 [Trichoderma barbatum]